MSDTPPYLITAEDLRAIAPEFTPDQAMDQDRIIAELGPCLSGILAEYGLSSRLRMAHFLAQILHESAGLRTTVEFASGEAYEGRLDIGNTEPGDGVRYKGRGLIQLTGRRNYRDIGARIGVDLEAEPERAAETVLSLRLALEYWMSREINAMADADDLIAVTRAVNGGLRGLDDRRRLLWRAKCRLAGIVAPGTLGPGSTGDAVIALQSALRDAGATICLDGYFGAATELAVRQAQARMGQTATGLADATLTEALHKT